MKYEDIGDSIIMMLIVYRTLVCEGFSTVNDVIKARGMQIVSIIVQKCKACSVFFVLYIPTAEASSKIEEIIMGVYIITDIISVVYIL